jgi:hypothetical protein
MARVEENALIREHIEYYRARASDYDVTSSPPGDPLAPCDLDVADLGEGTADAAQDEMGISFFSRGLSLRARTRARRPTRGSPSCEATSQSWTGDSLSTVIVVMLHGVGPGA